MQLQNIRMLAQAHNAGVDEIGTVPRVLAVFASEIGPPRTKSAIASVLTHAIFLKIKIHCFIALLVVVF